MSNETETKTPAATSPAPAASPTRRIEPRQIIPNTRVRCSNGAEVGTVDHMQGREAVKLRKDDKGVHHYIPLGWVARVDGTVHLDRPLAEVTREWSIEPPKA